MPFYERGSTRISYEEAGSGCPLLILPGGGLNGTLASLQSPFNPMERYKDNFRCIAADRRNAYSGQSSGPLEIDRPWDSYSDDHLGLMDHLGIHRFGVIGFCVAGPMILNLIKNAPERVVAAAMMQPSGFRPELPTLFYQHNMEGWGPPLCEQRADLTMDTVRAFPPRLSPDPPAAMPEVSCPVALPTQSYEYGDVPPDTDKLASPSDPPLQLGIVFTILELSGADGSVMVVLDCMEQLFASVTITVYVPGGRLLWNAPELLKEGQ